MKRSLIWFIKTLSHNPEFPDTSVHRPKGSWLKGRLCLHEKKDLLHCQHFIPSSSQDFKNVFTAIFQGCTLLWHIKEGKIINLLRISGLGHWPDPSYGDSNEVKGPQVRKGPCGDKVINIILTWISLILKNYFLGSTCGISAVTKWLPEINILHMDFYHLGHERKALCRTRTRVRQVRGLEHGI